MHLTGEDIRRHRNAKGLSQQALAEQVHITKSYISELESGKKSASSDVSRKLAHVLGICEEDEPLQVKVERLSAAVQAADRPTQEYIDITEALIKQTPADDQSALTGDLYAIAAQLYRTVRDYPNALHYAILAQEIFTRTNDIVRWCKAAFEKALINYDRADYEPALALCRIIELRLEKIGMRDLLLARVHAFIALVAAVTDNTELMADYLPRCQLSVSYVPLPRQSRFFATNEYLRGSTLSSAGAYNDAVDAFRSAGALYKSMNDHHTALRMLHNVAEAYYRAGDYEKAWDIASDVLERKMEAGQPSESTARTVVLLAEIAWERNDHAAVEQYCRMVGEDGVCVMERAKFHRLLARVKKARGNIEGFNQDMTRAMMMLKGQPVYQPLALEIVTEYMTENHLPGLI